MSAFDYMNPLFCYADGNTRIVRIGDQRVHSEISPTACYAASETVDDLHCARNQYGKPYREQAAGADVKQDRKPQTLRCVIVAAAGNEALKEIETEVMQLA